MKSADKRTYVRMCPNCGDTAEVSYKPKKDTWCLKCRSTALGHSMARPRKDPKDLIRYTRTCVDCGDTREVKAKPKEPQRCNSCSRSKVGKANTKDTFKYFRLCEVCGDVRQVRTEREALAAKCGKCIKAIAKAKRELEDTTPRVMGRPRTKPIVEKKKKPKKRKKKTVSKATIKAQQVLNREHRAYVEEEQAKPAPKQKISDEAMMAKWLSKHTVTTIEPSIYAMEGVRW